MEVSSKTFDKKQTEHKRDRDILKQQISIVGAINVNYNCNFNISISISINIEIDINFKIDKI